MSQTTPSNDIRIHAGASPIVPMSLRKRRAAPAQTSTDDGSNDFRRVDGSHPPTAPLTAENQPSCSVLEQKNSRDKEESRESWLKLHAADLIRKLQAWSENLDIREANLNVDFAKQDLRERKFRLHRQEIEAEILRQQLAMDELEHQLKKHARRVAFQSI